ncbi:MAG TPA: hypothetical protein PLS90_00800, partial [Candidatus Sumerlaeota bacterium]|nr:hypothetical protein [Candidatus Sumerlaeota bacterium]
RGTVMLIQKAAEAALMPVCSVANRGFSCWPVFGSSASMRLDLAAAETDAWLFIPVLLVESRSPISLSNRMQ